MTSMRYVLSLFKICCIAVVQSGATWEIELHSREEIPSGSLRRAIPSDVVSWWHPHSTFCTSSSEHFAKYKRTKLFQSWCKLQKINMTNTVVLMTSLWKSTRAVVVLSVWGSYDFVFMIWNTTSLVKFWWRFLWKMTRAMRLLLVCDTGNHAFVFMIWNT